MTARRAAVLVTAAALLLVGTSGCGLRDRAGTAGAGDAAPPVAASSPAQTSRAELPDQAPGPEQDAVTPAPAAKPPAVTEAQVRAVEAAVGAASTAVAAGEAEVASDG